MAQLPLNWSDPLSRLRLGIISLGGVVLALASFRFWCIQGLLRPIRIEGPSMAESLLGDHFEVPCVDCGLRFRCDAQAVPASGRAVCPNCGYQGNELRSDNLRPADRVLVDTWPYLWSSPRRGDLVMLVDPLPPDGSRPALAVKRVAALPGESLSIRAGDLFSGDQRIRKSLRELKRTALLVHDNDFQPKDKSDGPRWRGALPTSPWQAEGSGFRLLPGHGNDGLLWLAYHQGRAAAGETAKIHDVDSYNQAETRRLNEVRDLLLECTIGAKAGRIAIALRDPPHVLEVELAFPKRRFQVLKNGRPLVGGSLPDSAAAGFSVQAALCDGQFLLAHGKSTLAAFPYDGLSASGETKPLSFGDALLQIGAAGDEVRLSQLRVWRDIYYLAPDGRDAWQLPAPLSREHYFLLGDNQPVSIDSRQWGAEGVKQGDILGRVIARR